MGSFKVRYVVFKAGAYYFVPSKKMRQAGIVPAPLGKDFAKAIEQAVPWLEMWDAIKRGEKSNDHGTIKWLVGKFERSDWYLSLGDRTKENADLHLARITEGLGRYWVHTFRRAHCRAFHDKLVATKGRNAANDGIKWLRRLLNYGIEIEVAVWNPAANMNIRQAAPRRERWTPEEIEAFKAKAIELRYPLWALAVQLAYDTSQRQADILAVMWSAFDGEGLSFRQEKTGIDVWVPLSAESLRMLSAITRRSLFIIPAERGQQLNRHYFGRIFREIRAQTDMRPDRQFKDLRRTAASEIHAGGGNIEPITGHRPGSPVIKHYVVPDKAAARQAQRARLRDKE